MPDATTALVAAAATMVTASVALFGAVISKDVKITEFRQAWINDQRRDLAVVTALARQLSGRASKGKKIDLREFDEAFDRIVLRENREKNEWAKPIASIGRVRDAIISTTPQIPIIDREIRLLQQEAQNLLKTEWNRVRDGEETYRQFKKNMLLTIKGAIVLIIVMLAALAYGKGFITFGCSKG
ncbi:hypothetical protein OF829_16505 [Sphingomonas sp. LB-2]|uniref:hypothetical protein n=1 Tax=Sphingomonas caeni TaxID=2984949 RepID=UPI00222E38C6|nr:hypothetical protein [Sphingomonas caeni]MCW3848839.1 hypothetical protein [Sphingomonas caeni]